MTSKRASKKQQQLNVDHFKLMKKPMDHLGKQINVSDFFWQDRMLSDERDKVYKCTIIDFSLAHKFAPDSSPRIPLRSSDLKRSYLLKFQTLLTVSLSHSSHHPRIDSRGSYRRE